jgi:hypothetical protein
MGVQMCKTAICKFCNEIFDKSKIGGHTANCKLNPARELRLQNLSNARAFINSESREKMKDSLKEAWRSGKYDECVSSRVGKPGRPHTESTKKRLSDSRKAWLLANPEKHPWKRSSKFNSEPCQKLKDALRSMSIEFHEEFTPLDDRFFSLDIAFPAIMVGIEINGEQHYNRSGFLTPYYQSRHDLIESAGWKLYEIHYSICYDEQRLQSIVKSISETHDLLGVDLTFEIKHKSKSTKKFLNRQSYADSQKLPPEEIKLWQEAIESIDVSKLGFVGKLAKIMNCSHTHVRRTLTKHFPYIKTYMRKTSS